MKKLLLVVALIAGGLVVKAQDTKEEDVSSAKNTEQYNESESTQDKDSRTSREQQRSNSQDVPSKAKETLKSKYPEATNVEWGKEGSDNTAEFTVGESEYTVVFDNSGKWLSTKVDNMAMNEVPKRVKDGIQRSEFKAWNIEEIDFMDSPEKSTYKVEVKNGTREQILTVDKNGTILKKGDKS